MPVKSKKQKKFMQAVANNPEFAKKVGVKQSIGREFTKEKSMNTKRMNRLEELGRVDNEKAYTRKGKDNLMDEKKRVVGELKMRKGGKVKKTTPLDSSIKPGGTRFFDSDEVRAAKRKADKKNKKRIDKQRKELGYKAGGAIMKAKGKKMKKGGTVSSASKRADGCATKGHTRGRMV
jgi:hypothetical protein